MNLEEIRNPEDILEFMNENIEYGWQDVDGKMHMKTMKDFRRIYRTISVEDTLKLGIGCCIEQVNLMHFLFDKIGIKNKMFCCRIFEPDEYDNLEEEEHMHCFLLYYLDDKVYHIEHPNYYRIGIYGYNSQEDAINSIVKYYIDLRGGKESPTKEFFDVKPGISFKEFNKYINNLNTEEIAK